MKRIQINLRHAKPGDINSIIDLVTQLDRPFPKDSYEVKLFRKSIKSYIRPIPHIDNRGIILATSGQKVIGMVSFVLLDRLNQRSAEFWIPELVVLDEYRERGIGTLLIQKCETIARRKKCYRIRLESRNDRIDSHKFYMKIGFEQIALMFEKMM